MLTINLPVQGPRGPQGNIPSIPFRVLKVVVEPTEQDLLRWQAQELLQSLVFFQESVKFGVQLDVDLAQQAATNDLPDQAENEMLPNLDNISTSNVHDGTANAFGRIDDDVIILGHVESIQLLDLLSGLVQNTFIDGVRHAVVDQLGEDQAVLALIEHLERVGGEGQEVSNVRIAGQDGIDVSREFGSLIFVDRVGDVRR